jgi:hypothetical protein
MEMYIEVEEKLRELQRKIDKIEDQDSNFTQNEKWIKLRQQQDTLYDFKRQEMEEDERSL